MKDIFLLALAAFLAGCFLGGSLAFLGVKKLTGAKLGSVTRLLFVATTWSAIAWVFISYAIAIYSTVHLGQVYTMAELSEPALHSILGVTIAKVLENIFEHNDGALFGHSNKRKDDNP